MPVITIQMDPALRDIKKALTAMPSRTPRIVARRMKMLGPRVVNRMREAVEENRYTGALSDSIRDDYSNAGMTVTVGPTAKRGKWDAGLLLELGTRPIPNCPWMPIKAWADFRGIPAFPVWYKIRTEGVNEHPFLERTINMIGGDVQIEMNRMADEMAHAALYGSR